MNACPVGGAPVAAKIGEIMGVDAGEQVREVAFVKCAGTCEVAKQSYDYEGLHDCIMINMMQKNGPKACAFGCLGEGSCVQACQFDAIHVVDGVAVVDKEACKACGKCIDRTGAVRAQAYGTVQFKGQRKRRDAGLFRWMYRM